MKQNIGTTDRVIRIIIGLAIIAWGIIAKNWWGALGLVPLLTGLIGWCGLYQFMGSCCPFSKKDEGHKGDKPKSGGCCCGGHKQEG